MKNYVDSDGKRGGLYEIGLRNRMDEYEDVSTQKTQVDDSKNERVMDVTKISFLLLFVAR
jgi:hypothetical protein